MKTKLEVLLLGLLLCGTAVAQQVTTNSANQSAPAKALRDEPVAANDSSSAKSSVVVNQAQVATRPLKLEKPPGQAARRIEPGSRAWTTLAGWSPGTSAFADPMTHESKLILFTLRPSNQP